MTTFNNREIATGIWLLLFLAFALSKSRVRGAFLRLIPSVFEPKVIVPVALLILYVVVVVWGLSRFGLWSPGLIKDTTIWFASTGLVVPFSFVTGKYEGKVFPQLARDSFTIIIVIEFLVATYTFSLPIELVLIPFLAVVAMIDVVAKREEKYAAIVKLTSGIQFAFGAIVLTLAVSNAAAAFQELRALDTLRQLLLPAVLSMSLVPFTYLLLSYADFETLFLRLGLGSELDPGVGWYAKRRLIQHLRLNPYRARDFVRAHALELMRVRTRADIDALLKSVRHRKLNRSGFSGDSVS